MSCGLNIPYSSFIKANFAFQEHLYGNKCGCMSLGCEHHWMWIRNDAPNSLWVQHQLWAFNAFRNAPGRKQVFIDNYENFVSLTRPLHEFTLMCNWDSNRVPVVFDKVKDFYGGYVMPTTKTMHFFAPDLFLILDKEQVWEEWKHEAGNLLPKQLNDVNGEAYVALLKHVKDKIAVAVKRSIPFTVAARTSAVISSVEALRYVAPLGGGNGDGLPNTLGKAIDNLIRH